MWTCKKCGRIFNKTSQPHSCKKVPIEFHFKNKEAAKKLFSVLLEKTNEKAGPCKIISLPCCIHLFGTYDFLAALPKKERLEIRFALDKKINSPRLKISVPLSAKLFKNCFDIRSEKEIDGEMLDWINASYHLKDK